jgi:hypothetical protein
MPWRIHQHVDGGMHPYMSLPWVAVFYHFCTAFVRVELWQGLLGLSCKLGHSTTRFSCSLATKEECTNDPSRYPAPKGKKEKEKEKDLHIDALPIAGVHLLHQIENIHSNQRRILTTTSEHDGIGELVSSVTRCFAGPRHVHDLDVQQRPASIRY